MNPHYDTIAEACRTWLADAGDDDRDFTIVERKRRIYDLVGYFALQDANFNYTDFMWKVGL